MNTIMNGRVRISAILALSWILTFSTLPLAACRSEARDRALRTEFEVTEQHLRSKITRLEHRLIELTARNQSNRRILKLAGYLPENQSDPDFVTETP